MVNVFLTQSGGLLGPIINVLGIILNGIYEFLNMFGIQNAGLCIILFTFIINALMIPLTIKQQKFSKLSAKMNPELTKITAKYKGKKDEASIRKQQAETQAVYQKYGSNPTGGCLPLLISLPIMFALYRVIYNIPAYVGSIYELYNNIASGILETPGYFETMSEFAKKFSTLNVDKWNEVKESSTFTSNHLIDILAQFKTINWDELKASFPVISSTITENHDNIRHINSFIGGLNIADVPTFKSPLSLLIPILAVATQFLQTRMMTASAAPVDENNPTAASMKTMNNVMPLVSGGFCFMLPIGVGLYWISGSIFRIIQQFFVNKHMDKVDLDLLIEKNLEKMKTKNEKLGITADTKMQELAKKRTSSIKENASNTSNKNSSSEKVNNKKNDFSYEPGSISSIANMMGNKKNMDKGDK